MYPALAERERRDQVARDSERRASAKAAYRRQRAQYVSESCRYEQEMSGWDPLQGGVPPAEMPEVPELPDGAYMLRCVGNQDFQTAVNDYIPELIYWHRLGDPEMLHAKRVPERLGLREPEVTYDSCESIVSEASEGELYVTLDEECPYDSVSDPRNLVVWVDWPAVDRAIDGQVGR